MVAARLGGIIGNIVIAALLDLYCPLPTYIVAVLLIGLLIIIINTIILCNQLHKVCVCVCMRVRMCFNYCI